MITLWPIPVFSDNYVWVLQSEGHDSVCVVDPGDGVAVLAALEQRQLTPSGVLITHHHADHVGGIDELREKYQVSVYGPAAESIPELTDPVGDGARVLLPDLRIELDVIEVPGHTAGHVAYHGPGFVLCGDTLFAGGCGRVFEGTPEQMYDSLQRLAALPETTAVYCAHEYTLTNLRFALEVEPDNPLLRNRLAAAERTRESEQPTVPSTLQEELQTNPFLRCSEPTVRAAAERFSGAAPATEVGVFAAIRAAKDAWQG
jgi:hydroxyacylglutathione hydrolase